MSGLKPPRSGSAPKTGSPQWYLATFVEGIGVAVLMKFVGELFPALREIAASPQAAASLTSAEIGIGMMVLFFGALPIWQSYIVQGVLGLFAYTFGWLIFALYVPIVSVGWGSLFLGYGVLATVKYVDARANSKPSRGGLR